jgi:hypothetical protein
LDVKIKGMGTEVIRVRFEDVRLLASLPLDVEVVAALAPPHRHQYGDGWCSDPTFYLQIRHRYCVRCPDGSALMIDYLQNFLRRYAEIKADEDSKRGQRVPDDDVMGVHQGWMNDDEIA